MKAEYFILLIGILILAIITLISFFGQKSLNRKEKLRKQGIRVQGAVIGNKCYIYDNLYFHPVVQFETTQGKVYEIEDKSIDAVSSTEFVVGSKIDLMYDELNPENFLALTPENYKKAQETPWYLS